LTALAAVLSGKGRVDQRAAAGRSRVSSLNWPTLSRDGSSSRQEYLLRQINAL